LIPFLKEKVGGAGTQRMRIAIMKVSAVHSGNQHDILETT